MNAHFTLLPNCRAKNGKEITLLDYIQLVRSCKNSTNKKEAAAIVVSGVWKDRHTLEELNGVIHADLDDLDDVDGVFEKLKGDKYVLMVHKSISGKGLKVFAKVDVSQLNEGNYSDIVRAWINYLERNYGVKCDEKCTDIKRLSFIANDANLFYNDICENFNYSKFYLNGLNGLNGVNMFNVVDIGNPILDKIRDEVETNFNTHFVVGSRNNYINKFLWKCNRAGVDKDEAINYIVSNYTMSNDFNEKDVQAIANSVYSRCVYEFGCEQIFYSDSLCNLLNKRRNTLRDTLFKELTRDCVRVYFYRDYDNEKNTIMEYALIKDGKIRIQTFESILGMISERYEKLDEEIKKRISLFDFKRGITEKHLSNFNEVYYDYRNKAIYLKNCKILNGDIMPIGDELILASKILDIDYKDIDGKSKFELFIERAYGMERKELVELVIGYLLARESQGGGEDRVIMIMDDNAVDDVMSSSNGGTGKSLFATIIGELVGCTVIDGKAFDVGNRFALSSYNMGDGIILIDDVNKKFKFEALYSQITNGIRIERKFENVVTLPKDLGVKIIITSNYRIAIDGESNKRRRIDLFATNYYNADFSVKKDLGKMGLAFWDNEEKCRFIKYIAKCWKYYLDRGYEYLIEVNNKLNEVHLQNLKKIQIISDFVDDCYAKIIEIIEKEKTTNDLYLLFTDWCYEEQITYNKTRKYVVQSIIRDLKYRKGLDVCLVIKKVEQKTSKCLTMKNTTTKIQTTSKVV